MNDKTFALLHEIDYYLLEYPKDYYLNDARNYIYDAILHKREFKIGIGIMLFKIRYKHLKNENNDTNGKRN